MGGLVGGGGTTASSRYKYSDQALNYEQASDAMFCMRKRLSLSNYINIDSDHELLSNINDSIDEVRQNLRKRQLAIVFAEVDSQGIADRIRKSIEAQKEKEKVIEDKIKEETKRVLTKEKYNQVTKGVIKLNSKDKKSEEKNLIEEIEKIDNKLADLKIQEKIANDNLDKAKLLEQISICIAPK